MFIIEKPYASELIFDTILQNDWWILDNQTVRNAEIEEGTLRFISDSKAVDFYQKQEYFHHHRYLCFAGRLHGCHAETAGFHQLSCKPRRNGGEGL